MLILEPLIGGVYSNAPLRVEEKVDVRDPRMLIKGRHVCLDLGADEFTVGRPHPMIDMTLRTERIMVEAEDPETAVILLDVVLGYGAHADPVGVLAPSIRKAKARAREDGRELVVVVYICGTDRDLQGLREQRELFEEAGAVVVGSNAGAARMVGAVVGSR
jgi:FdrA protein